MNPKEKANNLFNKMIVDFNIDKWQSKQCALIAVDEIIKLDYNVLEYYGNLSSTEYWQEVKQEIEKL
jgi:hypothetical protein